jgi:hypothetical protein
LDLVSIEAGSDILRVDHEFVIDIVHHKFSHSFSDSSHIEILRTIEILGSSYFGHAGHFHQFHLNQIQD